MKHFAFIFSVLLFLNSCNSTNTPLESYSSENLKIEKISDKLFKHVSFLETQDYGVVPSNGIIYINNNEIIVFDTPVNDEAAAELIQWTGKNKIKAVVVTHFHIDCLGGLKEFHSAKIPSYANQLTVDLAKQNHQVLPKNPFDWEIEIKIGEELVLIKHFGEGHTRDNVVGYIPNQKALFGGCLVKSVGAGKGNLLDANPKDWPNTITRIKKELPEIEIVIPGHGKHGGQELLDYTVELFNLN